MTSYQATTAEGPKEKETNNSKKLRKPTKAELREQRLVAAALKEKQNVRDHFAREFKYTEKSIARGGANWEKMCVDSTNKRLEVETQVLIQGVCRSMDKAEYMMNMMESDRNIAEEMYNRNVTSHMDLLNAIYDKFKTFMKSEQADFDNIRKSMLKKFYEDCAEHEKNFHEANNNVENLLCALDETLESRLKATDERLLHNHDEIYASSVEKRLIMKSKAFEEQSRLLGLMNKVIDRFEYQIWPNSKYQEYIKKLNVFNIDQRDFKAFDEEYERKEATVARLLQAFNDLEDVEMMEVASLKNELKCLNDIKIDVERNLRNGEKLDSKNMKNLSFISFQVSKFLERKRQKGRNILSLSSMCQKYEKPTDLYPNYQLHHELEDDPIHQSLYESAVENFRSKISKVETQNICLKENNKILQRKNEELIKLIKEKQREEEIKENMKLLNLDLNVAAIHIPSQIYSLVPQLRTFKKGFKII